MGSQIEFSEINSGMVSRVPPRSNIGGISILFQDNVGGLECEKREISGTFNRVKRDLTSDLIVNVSETLQRWSNDRLLTGLHKVALPQEMDGSQSGMVPKRFPNCFLLQS